MDENKKDISGMLNSMFDENISMPTEESNNRDYLSSLYEGGIELLDSDIRMTRSEYIKKHTEIVEEFKNERKEALRMMALGVAAAFFLPFFGQFAVGRLLTFVWNPYAAAILRGFRMIFIIIMVTFPIIIAFSLLKRIKLLRKNENHALQSLEQRKQDFMLLGQYDAGK